MDVAAEAQSPRTHLPAGFFQRPAAELNDQPAFFGNRDEAARCYQAEVGVLPAHQRLAPISRPDARSNWVASRAAFPCWKAAAKTVSQARRSEGAGVQVIGVELVAVAAVTLCLGTSRLRRLRMRCRGRRRRRGRGDADARGQVSSRPSRPKGEKASRNSFAICAGSAGAGRAAAPAPELVPPGARPQCPAAGRRDSRRHLRGQGVAGGPAEPVVDILEMVDIDQHEQQLLPHPTSMGDEIGVVALGATGDWAGP